MASDLSDHSQLQLSTQRPLYNVRYLGLLKVVDMNQLLDAQGSKSLVRKMKDLTQISEAARECKSY